MNKRASLSFVVGALIIGALLVASCDRSSPEQQTGEGTRSDWPGVGGGTDESSYSQLASIDSSTIDQLGLAWSLDLPGEVSLEATPVAVDGTLYFSGSYGKVYAVKGDTGDLLWTYDPEVWKVSPEKHAMNFGVNRGVAYAGGKIFLGALDGRLIALNAKTGKEIWTAQTLPQGTLHTITGAPRVFNGKVIIGNAGADAMGQRGFVTAYDQETGKKLWRFYTVPGSPEQNAGDPVMQMAAATWTGEYWKTGTGGTVWNGITFDPELNQIYLGVGNAGPYNPRVRSPEGGDNLFVASIVALNADTGKYIWHYQMNPKESWDYKCTANMIAATLTIDGKERKVLMQSPTNGFFYVLDRKTGELISAEKTGKVTWADHIDLETGRPVEAPDIRYEKGETIMWPSMLGTHNWQAMSFSPRTGLVYIPYMQMGARYKTDIGPGELALGGMTATYYLEDEHDGKGALLAWDPVAQKERWRIWHPYMWNGGTLATEGGLVFQGTADGYFLGYDAVSGKELWRFNAGLGIIGAPMSYSLKGKQYVSVLVGYGGTTAALSDVLNVGWKYGAQPRRLLTFALGGNEKLPPSPAPDMTVHALDDPAVVIDEKAVTAGRTLYVACMACHGMRLHGAGAPGPDLRESSIALSENDLWTVLHDGALAEQGMPRFATFTRGQVHQIYSYIRAGAREVLGLREPLQDLKAAAGGQSATAAGGAATARSYSTAETDIGTLLDNPDSRAILDKYLPGFSEGDQVTMARPMTLRAIQTYAPDMITDEALEKIDADLANLGTDK